jgi:primosomal protein N' (replication factor Y)
LWGALDYLGPEGLAPGTLVRVPLGRRVVTGVVWQAGGDVASGLDALPISELKSVIEVLEGLPPLPPAWRQLVQFASGY